MTDRRDGDEAIQLVPERLAGRATRAVDPRGFFEVRQSLESEDRSPDQIRPDLSEALAGAGAREHLHEDRLGDRDVGVLLDQMPQDEGHRAPPAAEEVDPCCGVHHDHHFGNLVPRIF